MIDRCNSDLSLQHTALLLLPQRFSRNDLWQAITGLSYCGDPRFALGAENPMKVCTPQLLLELLDRH